MMMKIMRSLREGKNRFLSISDSVRGIWFQYYLINCVIMYIMCYED